MTALKAKIQEVFDEPACDKNQGKSEKERKKGCTKQLSPGAAARGGALFRAQNCPHRRSDHAPGVPRQR